MRTRVGAAVVALMLALAVAPGAQAAGPGAVDVSFGDAGQADGVIGGGVTTMGGGVVLQADGSIVTAGGYQVVRRGETFPGQMYAAIARFTADGDLDREFGTEGWTLDDRYDVTGAPAQQRDGKVVVPGGHMAPIGGDGTAVAIAARYDRDGAVDRDFGDGGVVRVPLPLEWAFAHALAIDSEGRILLAIQGQEKAAPGSASRFGVARLAPSGGVDRDYGENGVAIVDAAVGARGAPAIALLPDGGAVLAGDSPTGEPTVLARFDERGRAVGSWGDSGVMSLGFTGRAGELSVDADDRIVLVTGNGQVPFPRSAMVLRFGLDGKRDASFGIDGAFSAKIGASTDVTSSVLQRDGKRVIAGGFFKPRSGSGGGALPEEERPGTTGWALMRVRADGRLDRGFGGDGRVTSPLGPAFSVVQDIVQQEDGRYVAAGTSTGCGGATLTLVRYHGDDTGTGQPDPGPIVRPCPGQAPVESGGIELTIACPLVELTCEGDIVLDVPVSQYLEGAPAPTAAARAKTVRIAKGRYRMSGNRRLQTLAKLSPQGRRMARRGKRFRATATITSRDRRGKRRTTRARVLVAPK